MWRLMLLRRVGYPDTQYIQNKPIAKLLWIVSRYIYIYSRRHLRNIKENIRLYCILLIYWQPKGYIFIVGFTNSHCGKSINLSKHNCGRDWCLSLVFENWLFEESTCGIELNAYSSWMITGAPLFMWDKSFIRGRAPPRCSLKPTLLHCYTLQFSWMSSTSNTSGDPPSLRQLQAWIENGKTRIFRNSAKFTWYKSARHW